MGGTMWIIAYDLLCVGCPSFDIPFVIIIVIEDKPMRVAWILQYLTCRILVEVHVKHLLASVMLTKNNMVY